MPLVSTLLPPPLTPLLFVCVSVSLCLTCSCCNHSGRTETAQDLAAAISTNVLPKFDSQTQTMPPNCVYASSDDEMEAQPKPAVNPFAKYDKYGRKPDQNQEDEGDESSYDSSDEGDSEDEGDLEDDFESMSDSDDEIVDQRKAPTSQEKADSSKSQYKLAPHLIRAKNREKRLDELRAEAAIEPLGDPDADSGQPLTRSVLAKQSTGSRPRRTRKFPEKFHDYDEGDDGDITDDDDEETEDDQPASKGSGSKEDDELTEDNLPDQTKSKGLGEFKELSRRSKLQDRRQEQRRRRKKRRNSHKRKRLSGAGTERAAAGLHALASLLSASPAAKTPKEPESPPKETQTTARQPHSALRASHRMHPMQLPTGHPLPSEASQSAKTPKPWMIDVGPQGYYHPSVGMPYPIYTTEAYPPKHGQYHNSECVISHADAIKDGPTFWENQHNKLLPYPFAQLVQKLNKKNRKLTKTNVPQAIPVQRAVYSNPMVQAHHMYPAPAYTMNMYGSSYYPYYAPQSIYSSHPSNPAAHGTEAFNHSTPPGMPVQAMHAMPIPYPAHPHPGETVYPVGTVHEEHLKSAHPQALPSGVPAVYAAQPIMAVPESTGQYMPPEAWGGLVAAPAYAARTATGHGSGKKKKRKLIMDTDTPVASGAVADSQPLNT